jgi:hypothetical protein
VLLCLDAPVPSGRFWTSDGHGKGSRCLAEAKALNPAFYDPPTRCTPRDCPRASHPHVMRRNTLWVGRAVAVARIRWRGGSRGGGGGECWGGINEAATKVVVGSVRQQGARRAVRR